MAVIGGEVKVTITAYCHFLDNDLSSLGVGEGTSHRRARGGGQRDRRGGVTGLIRGRVALRTVIAEGAAGAAPPPPGGEAGGAPPPPPGPEAGGAPPPPGPEPGGAAGVTPESEMRDNMKILLESDSLIEDDSFIDLSKGKNSLGKMEEELNKLLGD